MIDRNCRALAPLLVLVLSACMPVGRETLYAVSEQAQADVLPGTSTRADILLRLGDPSRWSEQDGYFVYEWERVHGGVVAGFPVPVGGGFQLSCHGLAIRFRPDGVVADARRFDGERRWLAAPGEDMASSSCDQDAALEARIAEWLASPVPVTR